MTKKKQNSGEEERKNLQHIERVAKLETDYWWLRWVVIVLLGGGFVYLWQQQSSQYSIIKDSIVQEGKTLSQQMNNTEKSLSNQIGKSEKNIIGLEKQISGLEKNVDFLMSRVFPVKLKRTFGVEGKTGELFWQLPKPIYPKDVAETFVTTPFKGLTFKVEFSPDGKIARLVPNDPELANKYRMKGLPVTLHVRMKSKTKNSKSL